jgi:hypothetical protein
MAQVVVRREVAVAVAQRRQVLAQQREVVRLLGRHPPVEVERPRHAVEAPGRVQRQVDRD